MGTFTNRDRLRRRMKSIAPAVRRALKAQNAKNAADLVQTIKQFVPVDEMKLHDSVKHQDVSDSTRISQRVSAGNKTAYYGLHVEYGTAASAASGGQLFKRQKGKDRGKRRKDKQAHAATPAQPFFWPAWRLLRRRLKTRMSRAAKKAIAGAIQ